MVLGKEMERMNERTNERFFVSEENAARTAQLVLISYYGLPLLLLAGSHDH